MTEIRAVDVHDEAALHEWWATGHAAAADRAYDVYPAWSASGSRGFETRHAARRRLRSASKRSSTWRFVSALAGSG